MTKEKLDIGGYPLSIPQMDNKKFSNEKGAIQVKTNFLSLDGCVSRKK